MAGDGAPPSLPVDPPDGAAASRAIDIASGLFLVALALATLYWLIPTQIDTTVGEYDLSPAFFPRLAARVVLVLAVGLVVLGIVRHRSNGPDSGDGPRIIAEALVWIVVSVVIMLGLAKVGFVATSMVLIGAAAWFAGRRDWLRVGLVAILFPLLANFAAWRVFTVQLP